MKNSVIIVAILAVCTVSSMSVAEGQGKGKRQKTSLEAQKKFKVSKDKTNVDFDEASIEGQAKNPFGTLLNSRDQDFNKGFIKLRYNWHDQMLISASGMSQ